MAWELLFNSDYGLFSLGVIVATVLISIGYARFFSKKMREEESRPS